MLAPKLLLTALAISFFGSLFVAAIAFPAGYDWRHTVMSSLASPLENPKAFRIVSYGMAVSGIAQLRLVALQAKDPAYATASVTVACNASLKEGIVTLHNLPAPPTGHDYQLWVLDSKASRPRSAGLVNIATASRQFVAGSVGSSRPGFAISLEPSGGVSAPTGPILFVVTPQDL